MQTKIKFIAVLAFVIFALVLLVPKGSTQTQVETAGQKFKSIKVLNDMPADQMGKVMNMISASLGVDCKFCHTSNDGEYEKEGVEHKDTARKMMKMVFDLNKTQFNGRPEINCNSCHNGKSHPQPSFPLAPIAREERPKQPEKGPTADQIIAKFIAALGGTEKIAAVKTRLIKANRVEPDSKTTEPETIWLSDGRYRSDTAYGNYIVTELFAGGVGKKYGDWSNIDLKPDEVEQIRRAGVPIVLVDSTALPEHGSVEIDDVGGARAAAEHLIGLGHRDVLVIGVEPPAPSVAIDPDGVTSRRLRGYREAFASVGTDIPDERVVVGPASIDGGIAALNRAWEDGLRPTAVLAMSDAMAIGAMRALRDLRLTIPGDVSVVGFDDIDLAPHVDPPLTTVHQPIRRKGEEAVRLLLAVVQRRDQANPEHLRLETRLIVRGSSGPVPVHRHEEVAGAKH